MPLPPGRAAFRGPRRRLVSREPRERRESRGLVEAQNREIRDCYEERRDNLVSKPQVSNIYASAVMGFFWAANLLRCPPLKWRLHINGISIPYHHHHCF